MLRVYEKKKCKNYYFPDFSADTLQGRVYWATQATDIPFLGMDSDACLSTPCPVLADQKSTYHAEIHILKKYPVVSTVTVLRVVTVPRSRTRRTTVSRRFFNVSVTIDFTLVQRRHSWK